MKKSLMIFIPLIMALAVWLGVSPASSKAEQPLAPEVFNLNQQTAYEYLDNPCYIYANNLLYITDSNRNINVYENYSLIQTLSLNAKKFSVYRDQKVYLSDQTLHFGDLTIDNVQDYSISNDTLKTSFDDTITFYDLNNDEQLTNGTQFYTDDNVVLLGKNNDFYVVNEGSNYDTYVLYQIIDNHSIFVDEFISEVLAVFTHLDTLYCLTEDNLMMYSINNNVCSFISQIDIHAKDLTIYNDKIYLISRIAEVIEISLDLTEQKVVFASASSEDYFYNKPSAVSAKFGNIIVSDRMNNRLSIIDNVGQIRHIPITRPLAACANSEGNIFVITKNTLTKITELGETISQIPLSGANDIGIDSNDKVYVATNKGIVVYDDQLVIQEQIIDGKLLSIFNGKLTYYDGQNIYINGNSVFSSQDITSYAVDAKNSIFYIKNGFLYRYNGQETQICQANGKIVISGIKTSYLQYGDAIIVDSDKHCLYKLPRNLIGSANIEELYSIPKWSAEEDASAIKGNIIATTKQNVILFKTPAEAEILTKIPKDSYITIYYDAACPQEYVYVLYDDINSKTLLGGYVYASNINDPLEYILPDMTVGKINSNNTKIYKWPSVLSPTIKGITKNKNDSISIISFATNTTDEYAKKWYQDSYGKKWYRVKIDDTHEGYVMASDISTQFYSNEKMPDTNATITDYALVYYYDNVAKKYLPIDDLWVAKGTRVMVKTPFDSSQKYTKVVFYRDGYGTIDIDCYVETKYINFDGIDLLQFVAIIIILVTLTLITILLVRKYKLKKRKSILH